MHKVERAILTLQQRFYIGQDNVGSLLASRLREAQAMSHIAKIRPQEGMWAMYVRDKQKSFITFYQSLYTADDTSPASITSYLIFTSDPFFYAAATRTVSGRRGTLKSKSGTAHKHECGYMAIYFV
ncbi:hypothetical protein NDU88_006975 [Pleurodeles waltl]|uniref:Uncharacterized protein n=1 Tax=Pleurodeles waltl TaxID=8319 RepID=A0AAV7VP55_PLEWA|nr:hypothetical protein NDU88_006975 [Pleurodeles waltl]